MKLFLALVLASIGQASGGCVANIEVSEKSMSRIDTIQAWNPPLTFQNPPPPQTRSVDIMSTKTEWVNNEDTETLEIDRYDATIVNVDTDEPVRTDLTV